MSVWLHLKTHHVKLMIIDSSVTAASTYVSRTTTVHSSFIVMKYGNACEDLLGVMQLDGDLKGVSVQPVYSTDSLPPR